MEEYMIRFLVSLIVFAAGSVSSILLTGTIKTGIIFLDLPSFIIAVVVPFLFVSVLFGFKEMGEAFSTPFKKEADKEKLARSLIFFKTYAKVTWLAGLISVIIGVMTMLAYLDDMYKIGPMVALALVSLLYCGIINLVIIVPFTTFIKKHLKD
jgi:flagellar motor component MotA